PMLSGRPLHDALPIFGVIEADRALDHVVPARGAVLRALEPHHRLASGRHGRQGLARLGTPGAVVAGLGAPRARRFPHGFHFFGRAIAVIGGSVAQHLRDDLAIAVHALHLIERPFVGLHAQPVHAVQDGLHRFRGGTFDVGIFDAQYEYAVVVAGKRPGEQRRTRAAQVQKARGRRCEAGADGGRGSSHRSSKKQGGGPRTGRGKCTGAVMAARCPSCYDGRILDYGPDPPMLRHALAPLFEPRSLLIVADRPLPLADTLPPALRGRATRIDAAVGVAPELPPACDGLADGQRPDLAIVCVSPAVLPETLRRLAPLRPHAAIVLPHELPDPYPGGTLALCRTWAQETGCALLGPRAFGAQRPHAGLNLSQHPALARPGRV